MLGRKSAQQLAVQPIYVAHQLVEVVARAIEPQVDAHMPELRLVVDQQRSLAMHLRQVHRKMHRKRGGTHAALRAEKRQHRAFHRGAVVGNWPHPVDPLKECEQVVFAAGTGKKFAAACAHRAKQHLGILAARKRNERYAARERLPQVGGGRSGLLCIDIEVEERDARVCCRAPDCVIGEVAAGVET